MTMPFRQRLTYLILATIACLAVACRMPVAVHNTITMYPPRPLVPEPEKIIITNVYDVKAQSFRDNKEELFINLIQEAMGASASQFEERSKTQALVNQQSAGIPLNRDSLKAVMLANNATHGLFITSFDAAFDQTGVEVTQTDSGKERTASYDIVVKIGYSLLDRDFNQFDTLVTVRKFHSSRSVVSGLFAAGPNIVSNRKDALEGVQANVDTYMRSFYPFTKNRPRLIYVTKEFSSVGDAVKLMDYETAFRLSERLTDSKDRKVAALAYYNCAVLLENKGEVTKVKPYLEESIRINPTVEAQTMLTDYKHR